MGIQKRERERACDHSVELKADKLNKNGGSVQTGGMRTTIAGASIAAGFRCVPFGQAHHKEKKPKKSDEK